MSIEIPNQYSEPRDASIYTKGYEQALRDVAEDNSTCHWCERNDTVGSITDDLDDTYYWCSRHEDQVRSVIEDGENDT